MASYNLVNGVPASENPYLLREILRDEWGFDGLVMSDWFVSVKSTAASVNAGLDLEMPGPRVARREAAGRRRARRGGGGDDRRASAACCCCSTEPDLFEHPEAHAGAGDRSARAPRADRARQPAKAWSC